MHLYARYTFSNTGAHYKDSHYVSLYVSVSGVDAYLYIILSIIQERSIDSHYVLLLQDGALNMMD